VNYKPGTQAPVTGIYWCTVCKRPERFSEGEQFPPCKNMCGRGRWQLVQADQKAEPRA
jgi:hypothetical protein